MRYPAGCHLAALVVVALLSTGCGDDSADDTVTDTSATNDDTETQSEDMDITFELTGYPEAGEEEWDATGTAVDEGLICAEAAATGGPDFEYPDGPELTESELEELNDLPEPFSYVATSEYVCADGSGSFTVRALNDVEDPTTFTLTATWQLEGGDGYEGVTGEGQNDEFSVEGSPIVIAGSNTGVLRRA